MNDIDSNIEIVKKGYNKIWKWYREQRDSDLAENYLFQQFLKNKNHKKILELGCGSGFPIAGKIFEKEFNYTGIDLSVKQIELAKQQYPDHPNSFITSEMLEYCQQIKDNYYSGILSLFSIRHVPRVLHATLFTEIHRILQPAGYLLIDCIETSHDGTDLFANTGETMYWSGFSKEWTLQTLKDLGFILLDSMYYEKEFASEVERTLILLYQK